MTDKLLTFDVIWLDSPAGFNRDHGYPTGHTWQVRRRDMSGAIVAACNALKRGKHGSASAYGFTVRRAK